MKSQYRALFLASLLATSVAHAQITGNQLKVVADRYNQSLPRMVAPTLRQEKLQVDGMVFTYVYTDTNRTGKQMNAANLVANVTNDVFPEICRAPDTGRMLREGVTYRYVYFGNDRVVGAELIVRIGDCKKYLR